MVGVLRCHQRTDPKTLSKDWPEGRTWVRTEICKEGNVSLKIFEDRPVQCRMSQRVMSLFFQVLEKVRIPRLTGEILTGTGNEGIRFRRHWRSVHMKWGRVSNKGPRRGNEGVRGGRGSVWGRLNEVDCEVLSKNSSRTEGTEVQGYRVKGSCTTKRRRQEVYSKFIN